MIVMTADIVTPEIGQLVRITHGREQNQVAIIIKIIDDRYVLLADGDKRKYDRPKRKNVNHFEGTPFTSSEVRESLLETGRVSNGKLRFAVAKYEREVVTELEKGDKRSV